MANNYKGYLIKAGNSSEIMDMRWIVRKSYRSKPNQREEIEAYRDDYTRNLTRVTAPGLKSNIKFTLVRADLDTKIAIQNFFNSVMVNKLQRKVHLTIWNDEDNEYQTGYYYLPDIEWTIEDADQDTIYYKETAIELQQY